MDFQPSKIKLSKILNKILGISFSKINCLDVKNKVINHGEAKN